MKLKTTPIGFVILLIIPQLLFGLNYLDNYLDFLNNKYVVDGLKSTLDIYIFDFTLLILFLISRKVNKLFSFGIIVISLIHTFGISIFASSFPFPLKGIFLSAITLIISLSLVFIPHFFRRYIQKE